MEHNKLNTALLIADMQDGILSRLPDATAVIGKVANAIAHARSRQIPVIYVTVGFRPGAPEGSMNNKSFAAGKAGYATINMETFMKVHKDLTPQANDITVIKRRVSAFVGTDLELILRAQEIKHLVLTGIATSGVILSTTREAADKDYRITVLGDGCADADEEVHRVLTTKIFTRQADVMTVEDWSKL